MARIYANYRVNLDDLSFYETFFDRTSLAFLNDTNYVSPLGYTYQDVLQVGFTDGTYDYRGLFCGTDIQLGAGPSIIGGTLNAYVELVESGSAWEPVWGMESFAVSAVTVYQAIVSESTVDDYAVIGEIMAGADIVNLSPDADIASGYAGNDVMRGKGGNDTLSAGMGNDTLIGGAGADRLVGNEGADTFYVTTGDTTVEALAQGWDTVVSAESWTLAANVERLLLAAGTQNLSGTGNAQPNEIVGNGGRNLLAGMKANDTLLGGGGNDTLQGGEGFDVLGGGAGDDVLVGGVGRDTLSGGAGADAFVFASALIVSASNDLLTDFTPGEDLLRLDDDVFGDFDATVSTTLGAGQFASGAGLTAATDADQRILYDTTTGALYYDADGDGSIAAQRFGTLGVTAHPELTAGDFVIVG